MKVTLAQLDEWKKICEEATPGPWVDDPDCQIFSQSVQEWFPQLNCMQSKFVCSTTHQAYGEDANFIATARTAMPALIREVERLRVLLEQSISVAEQFGDFSNGITDEYGTVDEGRVMARNFYKKLQEEAGI